MSTILAAPSIVVHLTLKSSNRKTGPIPVSTSTAAWCPDSCPLKTAGCYGNGGPLAIHWRKVTEGLRGMSWSEFCAAIAALPNGTLWRHNQAGDLPADSNGCIQHAMLRVLVDANRGRRGFTYTHHDISVADNRVAVEWATLNGFTVNLSANNLQHADDLLAYGVAPVVSIVPDDSTATQTPNGAHLVQCPATVRDTSCADCKLCARRNRDYIITFPVHGSQRGAAGTIAAG